MAARASGWLVMLQVVLMVERMKTAEPAGMVASTITSVRCPT